MLAPRWLTRLCLALAAAAALAAGARADDDPEPQSSSRDVPATPAVDPDKAKTDKNLAAQADRHEKDSISNLRLIGIAVHSYSDTHNRLPDDLLSKANKPLLSWRVAVLPHVGQKALYQQFKLDEPWDSPNNKKLIARMPDVFRSPRVKVRGRGHTVYQVFTGSDAVFGRGVKLMLSAIPDGTSNTIMAVESSTGVPWTKPGGIPFDRKKVIPPFGKAYGLRPLAAMFDGSVRVLDLNKIQLETLKNAIDPADGNVLGNDFQ